LGEKERKKKGIHRLFEHYKKGGWKKERGEGEKDVGGNLAIAGKKNAVKRRDRGLWVILLQKRKERKEGRRLLLLPAREKKRPSGKKGKGSLHLVHFYA